jgi:hypothetical protein
MNLKSLFDLRMTNTWIVALGITANLIWSLFVMIIAFLVLDFGDRSAVGIQAGLLVSEFIGPFIIGWFCGWLAFDDRGPTYGVVGAIGSVLIILITLLASGGIAILLSIAALAGGFNGGVLSNYRGKGKSN